jgi:hypothetical protein
MTVSELIKELQELPSEFSELNCFNEIGEAVSGAVAMEVTASEGPHLIIWSI